MGQNTIVQLVKTSTLFLLSKGDNPFGTVTENVFNITKYSPSRILRFVSMIQFY